MNDNINDSLHHRSTPYSQRPDRAFQSAVSFRGWNTNGRRELSAIPQSIFRGQGLWLWGTDETTLIHNIKAGNQCCFMITSTPIPGLYFEAGMSFEEFTALLETPSEEWSRERLKSLPPLRTHQAIRMLTVEIGNSLSLDVEGPLTHAVMWGLTVL